jgi:hypothetical protein
MHLGTFPDGLEFATFVMSRNNYPFENMSIEDHQAIFDDTRNNVPNPSDLAGTWSGHLVLLPTTDNSLLNQVSPVAFRVSFQAQDGRTTAKYQVGPVEFSIALDAATPQGFREIDSDTILGMCLVPDAAAIANLPACFVRTVSGGSNIYFVLKRVQAAQPVAAP